MFAKHRLYTLLAALFVAAIIAGPSAFAASAPGGGSGCEVSTTWVTITDDQGIPWLVPVDKNNCTSPLACAGAVSPSPYPGWVSITDDLGIPWLVPASQGVLSTAKDCAPTQPAATSVAVSTNRPDPTPAVMPSPYPGWVIVVDDLGIPWLQPASSQR